MRRSRADDYVPPYPAYTSRYPPGQTELVFAQVGVQSREPRAGDEKRARLFDCVTHNGPGRPQLVERGWHVDAAGFRNDVALLYWQDADEMDQFWNRGDLRNWFDAEAAADLGWWLEALHAPIAALDANYSIDKASWGSGRLVPQSVEQFHGYYGSMRDRTPDFLAGRADGRDGQIRFHDGVQTLGRRLRVTAPDRICFIRGAFGWDQAQPEEQRAFMEEMFPVYRAGAEFLRDHPLETNCISARMLEEVHIDGSNFVQSETVAWFLTLRDLERWTHHHPTHAAIYGGVFRLMQKFDFNMRLNLGHEVVVVPEGGTRLEYINCHPRTGFLLHFPAVPL